MNNELLINEKNKDEEKVQHIGILIKRLDSNKKTIGVLEEEILEIEEALLKTEYTAIGIESSNIKVTITPPSFKETINYQKTLEKSGKDASLYSETTELKKSVINVTTTYKTELIEKELKDFLVTETTSRKASIKIKVLKKVK